MMDANAETRSPRRLRRRRLVLFPCPLQGHLNPMFQLAALLHSQGFSITVVHTHFNTPDRSKHPHFRLVAIPDGLSEELKSASDLMQLLLTLNANVKRPLRDLLTEMASEEEEPVACLISDVIMYSAKKAAEEAGVPRIAMRTGSAAFFKVFVTTFTAGDDQKRYDVPVVEKEHPPIRVEDLPDFKSSNPRDIYTVVTNVVEGAKTARALILNTFDSLESSELAQLREEIKLPVFPLGPLHKLSPNTQESILVQDRSCMEWLDLQRPASVLYVSFGSLASMSREELVEVAWGLADSRQPFLWVLRPSLVLGGPEAVALPAGFEEETRGRVVQWAPQQEVLGHPAVGGFWTHCGWNSALEGLCEGVPMLCWPFFGDQTINARYLTDVWEVGLALADDGCSRLERGGIERAVRRLMEGDEGKEMKRKAMDIKAEADFCVEEEGGSSRQALASLVDFIASIACPPICKHIKIH